MILSDAKQFAVYSTLESGEMKVVLCLIAVLACVTCANASFFDWFGTTEPMYPNRLPPMNATVCRATEDWSVVVNVTSQDALDTAVQTGYHSAGGKRFRYFALSGGNYCAKNMVGSCWTSDFDRWTDTTWSRCASVGGLFVKAGTPLHDEDLFSFVSVGSDVFTSPNSVVKCCHYDWSPESSFTFTGSPLISFASCEIASRLQGSGPRFSFPFWNIHKSCPDLSTGSTAKEFTCCAMAGETEEEARIRTIALGINNHTFYTSLNVRRKRCTAEDSFLVWTEDHKIGACPRPPSVDMRATSRESSEAYWVVESVLNNMGFKDLMHNQNEFFVHLYVLLLLNIIVIIMATPIVLVISRVGDVKTTVENVGTYLVNQINAKTEKGQATTQDVLDAITALSESKQDLYNGAPYVGPMPNPPVVESYENPHYQPYSTSQRQPWLDHVRNLTIHSRHEEVHDGEIVLEGEEEDSLGPFIPAAEEDFNNGTSELFHGDEADA